MLGLGRPGFASAEGVCRRYKLVYMMCGRVGMRSGSVQRPLQLWHGLEGAVLVLKFCNRCTVDSPVGNPLQWCPGWCPARSPVAASTRMCIY